MCTVKRIRKIIFCGLLMWMFLGANVAGNAFFTIVEASFETYTVIDVDGTPIDYEVTKIIDENTDTGSTFIDIDVSGVYEITGTDTRKIMITAANAEVVLILNNAIRIMPADIGSSSNGTSPLQLVANKNTNVTIIVLDNTVNRFECYGYGTPDNTPQAGINVPKGTKLTIMGQNNNVPVSASTGELFAYSGAYSAGIGGGPNQDSGEITILGGKITATARKIYGGAVTAASVHGDNPGNGAGIGGGGGRSGEGAANGVIRIGGYASVNATSENNGAGIGGGGSAENKTRAAGKITIEGNAIVIAKSNRNGAGIGSGGTNAQAVGSGGEIVIKDNVRITASSLRNGAGIGGGGSESHANSKGGAGGKITISGSPIIVAETGSSFGDAVDIGPGSSNLALGSEVETTITITGGNVYAKATKVTNGAAHGGETLHMTKITNLENAKTWVVNETKMMEYNYSAVPNSEKHAYLWLPQYEVQYDANSGTGTTPIDNNKYNVALKVTVLNKGNLEKTHYTFVGWNTMADGSGTDYGAGAEISISGNLTLYAKWEVNTYTIEYELDGGVNDASNPNSYTYGIGVTSFEDATKAGYRFVGWFDAASGGTQVTSVSTSETANVKLYARWVKQYTVSYVNEKVGATGTLPTDTVKYEENDVVTVKSSSLTLTGYTFMGWTTAQDGSGTVYVTSDTVTVVNSDITFYAKWEANTYTIEYELDGGVNDASNPNGYTYGIGVSSFEDATKTGYRFVGWFDAASGGTQVTGVSTSETANVKVYARWVKQYTVSYVNEKVGATGTLPTDTAKYEENDVVTVKSNSLALTGYTFMGWTTAQDGSGTVYVTSDTVTVVNSDITFYAKWEANTYTIEYELAGGVNDLLNPNSYIYGVGASLQVPSRTGYRFVGWFDAAMGGTQITSISVTEMGNIKLYAHWIVADVPQVQEKPNPPATGVDMNSIYWSALLAVSGLFILLGKKEDTQKL